MKAMIGFTVLVLSFRSFYKSTTLALKNICVPFVLKKNYAHVPELPCLVLIQRMRHPTSILLYIIFINPAFTDEYNLSSIELIYSHCYAYFSVIILNVLIVSLQLKVVSM